MENEGLLSAEEQAFAQALLDKFYELARPFTKALGKLPPTRRIGALETALGAYKAAPTVALAAEIRRQLEELREKASASKSEEPGKSLTKLFKTRGA